MVEPQRPRVLVVGAGKMGEALVAGWLCARTGPASGIDASCVTTVNRAVERRTYLAATYGVATVAALAEAPQADMVVLAVKPQVMGDVLQGIDHMAPFQGGPCGPLFVSIAAGLSTERLAAMLPEAARIVRVMPNMPLMVGEGASGVCAGREALPTDGTYVRDLFGCLGEAVLVDEDAMDAVCALSGSGPAYVATFIEALAAAGARAGLDAALSERLAVRTVLGTARYLVETGSSPAQTREAICSPGGTTLAGLAALDRAGFSHAVDEGVAAAAARSKELGSSC